MGSFEMNTFPIDNGSYDIGPGLGPLTENIFIRNEEDTYFKEEKAKVLKRNPQDHYCTRALDEVIMENVLMFLLQQYQLEGHSPNLIKKGVTPERNFDYFMQNIQEDLCIVQRKGNKNWLALAHVAFPSRWNPVDRMGQDFNTIHNPVPSAENMIKHGDKIVEACINKGPFERWAWGLYPTADLNFHPEDNETVFDEEPNEIFFRSERQCIVGLPNVDAFLFTIRPFIMSTDDLELEQKQELALAIAGMNEEEQAYKIGDDDLKVKIINRIMN